jgi:hypothetical protein
MIKFKPTFFQNITNINIPNQIQCPLKTEVLFSAIDALIATFEACKKLVKESDDNGLKFLEMYRAKIDVFRKMQELIKKKPELFENDSQATVDELTKLAHSMIKDLITSQIINPLGLNEEKNNLEVEDMGQCKNLQRQFFS